MEKVVIAFAASKNPDKHVSISIAYKAFGIGFGFNFGDALYHDTFESPLWEWTVDPDYLPDKNWLNCCRN